MNDFLAVPEESALEGTVRRQIQLTLDGLAAIPGEHGGEFVIAAVEHFVGGISCRKGGYLTHGVWRGAENCRMKTNEEREFCAVCQQALIRLIDFYTAP